MNVRGLGEYIRTQRRNAKLSLRSVSGLAGVSIPYLSQIERGLRKPSAEILQAIAKGLRISAETLYIQAGILEDHGNVPDVATAIVADEGLTERQKQALIQIYEAFRDGTGRVAEETAVAARTVVALTVPGSPLVKVPEAPAVDKALRSNRESKPARRPSRSKRSAATKTTKRKETSRRTATSGRSGSTRTAPAGAAR
jgi:transcriptional regulator with XRE-family HTH domain